MVFCVLNWFSFAVSSISNLSYSADENDVKIYRTDNSNWWYMDINLQDPETNNWLHFWTVKFDKESFTYTKQWEWDQKVWLIPWDGWNDIKFTIPSNSSSIENTNKKISEKNGTKATRTVIAAVPKTWPSGNIVWIILATFIIFGWYIYIRKKADI